MPNNLNNDNKYKAQVDNISNSDNNVGAMDDDSYTSRGSKKDKKNNDNTKNNDSSKKAVKTGAKVAANYFAPGVGGKVVDAVSKTKLGDKILNKGAEALNKTPGMAKAAKKLDDAGAIDAADKASDITSGGEGVPGDNQSPNGGSGTNSLGDSESSLSKIPGFGQKSKKNNTDSDNDNEDKSIDFTGMFSGNIAVKIAIISIVSGLGFVILLLLISLVATGTISDYGDAIGISQVTGDDTGGVNYTPSSPEEKAFYDRVMAVKNQFQATGKSVDPLKLVAVYHIINRHNSKYDYEYMTASRLTVIANAMFEGNSYSETAFRKNLVNNVFPTYFPDYSEKKRDKLVDEVFEYIKNYYDLIKKKNNASCGPLGSCTYEIKGVWAEDRGNVVKDISVSNLQVRLMEAGAVGSLGSCGGTYGQELGEELVDFEKYVLGVCYAEMGGESAIEAQKAQIIAARGFSLVRDTIMGSSHGNKLEQEGNQWIMQITNCVSDQVYCDPDQGCSKRVAESNQYGNVYSGVNNPITYKPPLAEDAQLRQAASAVLGEVVVNREGYIMSTNFAQSQQNQFSALAAQGYDYKQILLQVYGGAGATDIKKMSCSGGNGSSCATSTGDFASWKQGDSKWSSISLGNSSENIGSAGCLVTSVSMLIAKSGVQTTVDGEFNPGSFVHKMTATGGFSGANFVWAAVSNAAPNFNYVGKVGLSGYSREQKLSAIKDLINQGYYIVAEVKGNTGQHWVAIDSVNGSTVNMMDPGSQSTNMWEQYDWNNTSQLAYFKAS